MTVVQIGNDQIDLDPFVQEAIDALGYVRADKADWLAGEIAAAIEKNNGRTIREGGTRLDKRECAALGIVGWGEHLSREVWDCLTEKGRADPVACFDDTCARVARGVRLLAQRKRAVPVLRPGGPFAGVIMSPPPAIGLCVAGMAMVGKILPEPPTLPFPGCNRNVCGCAWRLIMRHELKEKR